MTRDGRAPLPKLEPLYSPLDRRRIRAVLAVSLLLASCTPPDERNFYTTAAISPGSGSSDGPSTETAGWQSAVQIKPTVAATASAAPAETKSRPAAADKVRELAAAIAAELAERCPFSDVADQTAFDACKKAMYGGSKLRASLSGNTLWGRQHRDPETALKDTNLTQFGPEVLTGMYMPLFMFSGKNEVTYSPKEKLYRVELGVRFRNRLQPGQFPYPFWHEDEKWGTYEKANALLLWVDPKDTKVRVAQFSMRGTLEPASPNAVVAQAKFNGQWMWTDAQGQQQPKVTLFDGLYHPENPYLKKLDASYRELALSLREGQCTACHVPNNPNKMKRLVLMQTPAHAASEIKRIMSTVKRGSMPLNEVSGVEEPLSGEIKGKLLARAAAFEKLVDAAKAWEAMKAKPTPGSKSPEEKQPVAGPMAPKKSAQVQTE